MAFLYGVLFLGLSFFTLIQYSIHVKFNKTSYDFKEEVSYLVTYLMFFSLSITLGFVKLWAYQLEIMKTALTVVDLNLFFEIIFSSITIFVIVSSAFLLLVCVLFLGTFISRYNTMRLLKSIKGFGKKVDELIKEKDLIYQDLARRRAEIVEKFCKQEDNLEGQIDPELNVPLKKID